MSFYEDRAVSAGKLISKFGQTVTVTRTSGEEVDPITGTVTAGTEETFLPKGIFQKIPDSLIDGSRITDSDRMLILDDTVAVDQSDTITISGQEWPIQDIKPSNPAGTPLVYFVRVRR